MILTARDLPAALRWHFDQDQKSLRLAATEVCHRGVAEAVRLAKEEDVVDRAEYIRGFRVESSALGDPVLVNSAPHAVYVENGRRPGAPMPPHDPIAGWARRKLGITDAGRVFLIRRAIGRRGIRPKFIHRRVTALMLRWYRAAVTYRLARRNGIRI